MAHINNLEDLITIHKEVIPPTVEDIFYGRYKLTLIKEEQQARPFSPYIQKLYCPKCAYRIRKIIRKREDAFDYTCLNCGNTENVRLAH